MLAKACPPALPALAPSALVLADARPPALLALVPSALVRADARPPALLALVPLAQVLADARPPALLATAPLALVRTDVRPPALLAPAPSALVRADTARLLLRGAPRRVGLPAHPPLARTPAAASFFCRRGAILSVPSSLAHSMLFRAHPSAVMRCSILQ